MALVRRLAMVAALLAVALPFAPWTASATPAPPPSSADLPRLTRELQASTARAQQLTEALNQAAARDGGLRVSYARLEDSRYTAQVALDTRARQVYMAMTASALGNWEADLAAPALKEIARRGQRASLTVDQDLIDDVTAQARQIARLQREADAFRAQLVVQAQDVLAEQDRARELYAAAKAVADAEQAAQVQALLEQQRLLLDDVSATVTLALTPAQTRRSRKAHTDQAPVVALLERSGAGVPVGYTRSGTTFSGTASWYGPGFVGRPTASGAPYDPERATCAHKTLPLGTVLYVSANGFAVSCLVNDRGPYIGQRVLDLSRAGSRALGYSGLAEVVVEVLVPTG